MIWEGPDDQGDSPAQKHQPDNKLMKMALIYFYSVWAAHLHWPQVLPFRILGCHVLQGERLIE